MSVQKISSSVGGGVGKSIVELGLPNSIIIALIERNNKFFISDGSTKLLKGDVLYIMADGEESLTSLSSCLGKAEAS